MPAAEYAYPSMPRMSPQAAHDRYVDVHADSEERTWGTFNHLAGMLALLDGGFVFGLIGAAVMWRIKADRSPFLDDHGREAVNFQLSMLLYTVVGSIIVGIVTLGVGLVIWLPLLWILRLIFGIKAAMAANRGEYYRYPICIRFIATPER